MLVQWSPLVTQSAVCVCIWFTTSCAAGGNIIGPEKGQIGLRGCQLWTKTSMRIGRLCRLLQLRLGLAPGTELRPFTVCCKAGCPWRLLWLPFISTPCSPRFIGICGMDPHCWLANASELVLCMVLVEAYGIGCAWDPAKWLALAAQPSVAWPLLLGGCSPDATTSFGGAIASENAASTGGWNELGGASPSPTQPRPNFVPGGRLRSIRLDAISQPIGPSCAAKRARLREYDCCNWTPTW